MVLAYSDVILPNSNAKILDGLNPYFRVSLTANFLLFSPNIGDIIGNMTLCQKDFKAKHFISLFVITQRELYTRQEVTILAFMSWGSLMQLFQGQIFWSCLNRVKMYF